MMKKTVLAMVLAATMVSGCSMIGGSDYSVENIKEQGDELLTSSTVEVQVVTDVNGEEKKTLAGYQTSTIKEGEIARLSVNAAFLAAKPVFDKFSARLKEDDKAGRLITLLQNSDDEEATWKSFTKEEQDLVGDFFDSEMMEELMDSMGEVAQTSALSIGKFMLLDQTKMMSDLPFETAYAEKDLYGHTYDQTVYLKNSVVKVNDLYVQVQALRSFE